jgi:CheY-like chemotaxis protein
MPPTILIAEDYDDNRELLRLLLAGANYDVREARNGRECPGAGAREPAGSDYGGPLDAGLDGWEVFRELKANSSTAHIPCVAVRRTRTGPRRACNRVSATSWESLSDEELLLTVARLVSKESGHK